MSEKRADMNDTSPVAGDSYTTLLSKLTTATYNANCVRQSIYNGIARAKEEGIDVNADWLRRAHSALMGWTRIETAVRAALSRSITSGWSGTFVEVANEMLPKDQWHCIVAEVEKRINTV